MSEDRKIIPNPFAHLDPKFRKVANEIDFFKLTEKSLTWFKRLSPTNQDLLEKLWDVAYAHGVSQGLEDGVQLRTNALEDVAKDRDEQIDRANNLSIAVAERDKKIATLEVFMVEMRSEVYEARCQTAMARGFPTAWVHDRVNNE